MKLPNVPPVAVTSVASKSVAISERVNVIMEVAPEFTVVHDADILIVGGVISTTLAP